MMPIFPHLIYHMEFPAPIVPYLVYFKLMGHLRMIPM